MKKIFVQHKFLLTLLLFLFASLASIYLTGLDGHIWSFLDSGHDGRFHIVRMEGLYRSIKNGVYFPTVNMFFLNGFGYISNVFYSNLWLYPVAMLRLAGLSVVQAFVTFYVFLNFVTFVTSFWSYYQASHRYDKSLLFSFIYTLSTYRIYDMVRRFDIGEVLTMIFLPIVILGVYQIFYNDERKWFYLTIGMTAVIYSHALSPVLIAVFILWVIIFRLKVLLKQARRILALIYAGLTSLLLSLAYFLPIIEQLKHTQFKLTYAPLINVSQTGLNLSNFFQWSLNSDIYNPNIGIVGLIIAVLIPFTIWKVKIPAIRDFAIIGEILLFMTTNIFPWKLFDKTPLNMIQFPWRFLMIITILFAIYLAYDGMSLMSQNWKKGLIIVTTIGIAMFSGHNLVIQHPDEVDTYQAFNNIDTNCIGVGEEYLPKEADYSALIREPHTPQVISGTVKISDFKQNGSKIDFAFQNAKDVKISVPIIAYYGYSARTSTGKVSKLTMNKTNNGLGQIIVNGTGTVRVNYVKTPIQKFSKILSIFSLVVLILLLVRKKL